MTCPRSVREIVSHPGTGDRSSELLGAQDVPQAAGHIPGTGSSGGLGLGSSRPVAMATL